MSIFSETIEERLAGWRAASHDGQCEQRERNYICHCRKRARIARGLVTPPTEDLYFPPPDCPSCDGDLDFDGDVWRCYPCSLKWDPDGRASTAEFFDDYGTEFGGEQFGALLRDLAAVIP